MKLADKVVLIILDGWGVAPAWGGNAIEMARTPNIDKYWKENPHTTLRAAEEAVGLPHKEMGNSEVGHLNLGCGQIVYQNLPGITSLIGNGSFFANKVLVQACEHVKKEKSVLHLFGLVSDGGIHSFNGHLYALLELAKRQGIQDVRIHVITDGRDTDPMKALSYLSELEQKIAVLGVGQISSVMGRYYAMDRDHHWERIKKAYDVLVKGEGPVSESAQKVISENYRQGKNDEFIIPTMLSTKEKPFRPVSANDSLIFFNFRADRARQIIRALVENKFYHFPRRLIPNLYFATFSFLDEYVKNSAIKIVFELRHLEYSLARVLSEHGLSQFHLAETEKYAHVTFFFNGGREGVWPKEYQLMVNSPKVPTFDLKPSMSAPEITKKLLGEFKHFDFSVVNFANADMVGHTGNIKATIRAVEAVDKCIGQLVPPIIDRGYTVIITADHGNAEQMINLDNGEPYTEHTTNPVPFILISKNPALRRPLRVASSQNDLILSDVAPTILDIMSLEKPSEMTGNSLLTPKE